MKLYRDEPFLWYMMTLFEVGKPAHTKLWGWQMLTLKNLTPDLSCFLNQYLAVQETTLLTNGLLPIREYALKNRPVCRSLTE